MTPNSFYPLHITRHRAREVRLCLEVLIWAACVCLCSCWSQVRTAWYWMSCSILASSAASSFLQMCHVWAGNLKNQQTNPAQQMLEARPAWANRECGDNINLPQSWRGKVFIWARDGRGGRVKCGKREQGNLRVGWGKGILWSRSNTGASKSRVNGQ